MKKFINEFKEFAIRGNVIDMAVGVVIGSAITAMVTSLVGDIIMPFILAIFGVGEEGSLSFSQLSFTLNGSTVAYGSFLIAIVNFILIAFALFIMVKGINTLKASFSRKETEKAAEPAPESTETVLLREILETLKTKEK